MRNQGMRVVVLIGSALAVGMAAQAPALGDQGRAAEQTLQEQKEAAMREAMPPEAYRQRQAMLERRQRINEILVAVREGRLETQEAQRKLHPLVTVQVKAEREQLTEQIERLKAMLAELEELKLHPERVIERRVAALLSAAGEFQGHETEFSEK